MENYEIILEKKGGIILKRILKISLIFLFFLLIFSVSKAVNANSISRISMDIYVDKSGNATVNRNLELYN